MIARFLFATSLLIASYSHGQVRSAYPKLDEILPIKTALGIATIIQLPDTIQSAIIGDQSGFKIEALDKAVTIKPLRWGAKTNLYLVTNKRRYNLRLVTLNQESADFIIYIKNYGDKEETQWFKINEISRNSLGTLAINRVGKSSQGFILLEGQFVANRDLAIKPEQFWIRQNNNPKTINGLYLSETKMSKNKAVRIGLSLAKSDLEPSKPILFELNLSKKLNVTISKDFLWK